MRRICCTNHFLQIQYYDNTRDNSATQVDDGHDATEEDVAGHTAARPVDTEVDNLVHHAHGVDSASDQGGLRCCWLSQAPDQTQVKYQVNKQETLPLQKVSQFQLLMFKQLYQSLRIDELRNRFVIWIDQHTMNPLFKATWCATNICLCNNNYTYKVFISFHVQSQHCKHSTEEMQNKGHFQFLPCNFLKQHCVTCYYGDSCTKTGDLTL